MSKTKSRKTSKLTSSSICNAWWWNSWAMKIFFISSSNKTIRWASTICWWSRWISRTIDAKCDSLPTNIVERISSRNSFVLQRMRILSVFLNEKRKENVDHFWNFFFCSSTYECGKANWNKFRIKISWEENETIHKWNVWPKLSERRISSIK